MSPRERVLNALAHRTPDRTPRDFWAEDPAWNRLQAHLGLPQREQVLRHLGIDVRHVNAITPPERAIGHAVVQNFWGERYTYQPTPWGPMREDLPGALAQARTFAELREFPWPSVDSFDYRPLRDEARQYDEFALVYGFADVWQRPALVRGWEAFFLDLSERPDWAHDLCRRFTDFYLEDYTRAAEATHGRIDLYLLISDLGSQRGPLISPAMFQQFVAPYLKAMIDRIHQLGGKTLFHSCGLIYPLIPALANLGVDVLDPIQPASPAMAPERLKAEFGRQLCFHGGIDMQRLLPLGSPDAVRAEVHRYCTTLGHQGGYVLAPAHLFQPDVPPENIVAMYDQAP